MWFEVPLPFFLRDAVYGMGWERVAVGAMLAVSIPDRVVFQADSHCIRMHRSMSHHVTFKYISNTIVTQTQRPAI
jgi:hypothetical protein